MHVKGGVEIHSDKGSFVDTPIESRFVGKDSVSRKASGPMAIVLLKKMAKALVHWAQLNYEIKVAPFLALRASWILWPFYKALDFAGITFVVNIADGTGHIVFEVDNFLRMLELNETPPNRKYLWIRKKTPTSSSFVGLYRHRFYWATANTWAYDLFLPITMGCKILTLDCGLSRLKWQLPESGRYGKRDDKHTYLHQLEKQAGNNQWVGYHHRRTRCGDTYPLQNATGLQPDRELLGFLGGSTDKIVLVHIRLDRINATAEPTDPETYLEALHFLIGQGYRLVFAGRERFPEVFNRVGCLNYANSSIATFTHDLQLFNLASMAIMAGSGIAGMADCLNKPYLYLNSWHLSRITFGKKCIGVPALIRDRKGELLTVSEQIGLYDSLPDVGPEIFPATAGYSSRNATSEEILLALKELMVPGASETSLNPLQKRFNELSGYAAKFRVSESFLRKHSNLIC